MVIIFVYSTRVGIKVVAVAQLSSLNLDLIRNNQIMPILRKFHSRKIRLHVTVLCEYSSP